jgi:TRAP-type mannitol/chloroaromatic compound transport system permease small subunit
VAEAYRVNESSQNPTGLPYRWLIKGVVPVTMVLIFIAAVARLIQELMLLQHAREPEDDTPGRVSMIRHLFRVQANESCDRDEDGSTK